MKKGRDDDNTSIIDPYDFGYYGRYEFFLYTTSVGVVMAVLSLVGSFTGLLEKKGGTLAVSFNGWLLTDSSNRYASRTVTLA